jgi:hypothetical protein
MSDDRPAATAASAVVDLETERRAREEGRKPPEAQPAGECMVCRGQLVPEQRPAGYASWFGAPGWFCERCGIRYHHLPSRPPRISDDDLLH